MNEAVHTSLYTIFLKRTHHEDRHLLVHGYTGAIDYVSDAVMDFLRAGGRQHDLTTKAELDASTTDHLLARGYLTSRTPYEERDHVRRLANLLHRKERVIKNWLFLVAYDCNFRCPYCFENGISSAGKSWSKKVFTRNAVDQAYRAMLEIEPNREAHDQTITLYGGEPLMAQNKEIVDYIIEQGTARGYSFSAITNGYDLEHFTQHLRPDRLSKLQITIDGTQEKHDQRRTHYQAGRSFDKIICNVQVALDLGVAISIRVNTDVNNFADIRALRAQFQALGFFDYPHFRMYSALIHGNGEEMNCNTIMAGTHEAAGANDRVVEELPGLPTALPTYDPDAQYVNFDVAESRHRPTQGEATSIQFFHNPYAEAEKIKTFNRSQYIKTFMEDTKQHGDQSGHVVACQDFGIRGRVRKVLEGRGLMEFKATYCGAQTSMMVFDPYGDMYTCWELVGMDRHKVGDYREGVTYYDEELRNWYGRNVGTTQACGQCKYAFFCGGGCMAGALREGRGYNSPYCDGFPKTFQEVVPDAVRQFEQERSRVAVPAC